MANELYKSRFLSDANLLSYYRFEGNSNDSKGSNNGTDTSVDYSASYGKFGQGARFNGGDWRIKYGNDLFRLNTHTNLTISLWFQVHTAGDGIIADCSRNDDYGEQWNIQYNTSTGTLRMRSTGASTGAIVMIQNSQTVTLNTGVWYHYVAIFKNGDNDNWKQYLNGKDISGTTSYAGGASTTTTVWTDSTANLVFGALASGGSFTEEAEIYLDDVAIFSRALSSREVAELYRSYTLGEFNPTSSTQGYWSLNGDSNDLSGNNNNITNVGADIVAGMFGAGYDFVSSSSDHMKINLPTNIKTANVTFSAWVKPDAVNVGYTIIAAIPRGAGGDGRGFVLNTTSGAKVQCLKGDASGSWKVATGATNISASVWSNIIATFDGSNIKVYLNGNLDGTTADAVAINWTDNASGYPNPGQLYFGATKANSIGGGDTVPSDSFYNGLLDEIIIESRAWSAAEVRKYYTQAKGRFALQVI